MSKPFEFRIGSVALVLYKVADPQWRLIVRNVYAEVIRDSGVGKTIGWALTMGRWCLSFVFRRP